LGKDLDRNEQDENKDCADVNFKEVHEAKVSLVKVIIRFPETIFFNLL